MATEFRSTEDAVQGHREEHLRDPNREQARLQRLEAEQNIAAILEKYAWLYNPEIVRRVEETYRRDRCGEQERLRRVYYYSTRGLYRAADRSPRKTISSPSRRTLP